MSRSAWNASIASRMREEWDARARQDPYYYIATLREQWTPEDFFASGRQAVKEHILNDMINICGRKSPKRMRVLELGCGVGRITRALSEVFGEVHGVDISGEMIERGRGLLSDRPNVTLHQNNGTDLSVLGDLRFDFAFSYIVFQHIPNLDIIESYIREVGRLLRPGCLFKFQVQGSSKVELSEEQSWVGAPVSDEKAVEIAARQGFEPRHRHGANEQYFWLWYFKPRLRETWTGAVADPQRFESQRLRWT